jgi:hypothetical protein
MLASRPIRASILAAAIAMVAVVAPAAASTVETTVTHDIHLDITLFGASQACGFTVELHSIGKEVSILQYDADGNLRSELRQLVYTGYVLNPTNGKTISSKVAGYDKTSYNADGSIDLVSTGTTHRNAPGYGLVSGFIGRDAVTLVPTGEVDEDGFPIYEETDASFNGQFLGNDGMCAILS